MEKINKRYDFVLFFDVKDGNPNGDPDAGNLPRIDSETGTGLVTDVCLKRKIRNYIQITEADKPGYDIYIKEKTVLGHAHSKAFEELDINLGDECSKEIPEDILEIISDYELPEGLEVIEKDDEKSYLFTGQGVDKKIIKESIKENPPKKQLEKFLNAFIKDIKTRQPNKAEIEKGRVQMCKMFYDIRTFGAVLALKSSPNCGQVRGPVQLTFARSVEPIVALEHCITRVAKTTEERAAKGGSEMGRKYTVPYGLYRAHGFVSAFLAEQTGFSAADLQLLWDAMLGMFEHDHSAARGLMCTRKLIIFEHETALGNKPAHELFDRIKVHKISDTPAREYSDFEILLDGSPFHEVMKIIQV